MSAAEWPVPRLPVLGWQAWRGARDSDEPCLLDLPGCHLTTSGRASIALALEVLGIQPGDGVLLPTYHCPTMVAPTAALEGRPRFYPIDANGAPDLAWLGQQDLTGVRVMLVAHFFGLPQPISPLRQWCDLRGIALLEDCAHALLGHHQGQPVGSWGDVAIGSLTKFLPVPEGGCLLLNRGQVPPRLDPCPPTTELRAWLDTIEEGARHGRLPGINTLITAPLSLQRWLRGRLPGTAPPTDPAAGGPGGMGAAAQNGYSIDMALAHRRIPRACRWLAQRLPRRRIAQQRRANYLALARRLSGRRAMRPLMPTLPLGAVPYVLPLWVRDPDPGYQHLRALRTPVFRWDRRWPDCPSIEGDHGALWSHHVIQVACHQDLADADLERIVEQLSGTYPD